MRAHEDIDKEKFFPTMNRLAEIYEKMCEEAGPCKVDTKWIKYEFSEKALCEMLCASNKEEKISRSVVPLARVISGSAATSTNTNTISIESVNKQHLHRRSVLVPLSGGIASLACAWWALQQRNVDVYFCHLTALDRSNSVLDSLCLAEFLRYARDADGKPLFANVDSEDVYRSPSSRIKILPMPTQPYTLDCNDCEHLTEANQKHHPLTYILMYRQLLNAAVVFGCTEIAWGLFDLPRELVQSIEPLMAQKVFAHQNVFPFATRGDALAAFEQASCQSMRIWQNVEPQLAASQLAVVQTCSASIMPDAPHYVQTCGKSKREPALDKNQQVETAAEHLAKVAHNKAQRYNWCGECVDCKPWLDWLSKHKSEKTGCNKSVTQKHALADAYNEILKRSQNLLKVKKPSKSSKRKRNQVANQPKKRAGCNATLFTGKNDFENGAKQSLALKARKASKKFTNRKRAEEEQADEEKDEDEDHSANLEEDEEQNEDQSADEEDSELQNEDGEDDLSIDSQQQSDEDEDEDEEDDPNEASDVEEDEGDEENDDDDDEDLAFSEGQDNDDAFGDDDDLSEKECGDYAD